jgi:hypothetical protein
LFRYVFGVAAVVAVVVASQLAVQMQLAVPQVALEQEPVRHSWRFV